VDVVPSRTKAGRGHRPSLRRSPTSRAAGRRYDRHRHDPGRSVPDAGEIIAPGVGNDAHDPNYHNNSRTPKLSAAPAGAAAGNTCRDRRHLLPQSLVCHIEMLPRGWVADRLRRRGGQLLWPRPAVTSPATRSATASASPRGERGVWERPLGPGKLSVQHLRRHIILGADHQLSCCTGFTGKSEAASLRREPALDRPRGPRTPTSRCYRCRRRPHRLPEGARRSSSGSATSRSSSRRRSDPIERLLPRRGPQEDDAGTAPAARRHPGRGARGSCAASSATSIECVDVLIGKPDTPRSAARSKPLLEQLRLRSCRSSRSRRMTGSAPRPRS